MCGEIWSLSSCYGIQWGICSSIQSLDGKQAAMEAGPILYDNKPVIMKIGHLIWIFQSKR